MLEGNSYDRFPCIPLVFGYAANVGGLKLRKYLQNGEYLALCQMNSQRKFGYDAVFVYGDNCIEAEAVGCKLHFPENAYPYITKYVAKDFRKFEKLKLPNPKEDGRMPELLKAARLIKSNVGNDLPIVGILLGPMSIAGQLMGLENLLYLLIDTPHKFTNILNYTSEISMKFGLALLEAGVHIPLILEPSASQSIIPSEFFIDYLIPYMNQIIGEFKIRGALASWLMITGNTRDILPYFSQCGADIVTVDYEVSLQEAFNIAPELILAGNVKPFSFVNNLPQSIHTLGKKLIKLAVGKKGFILSSGCELPLDTRPENIFAFINSVSGDF